MNADLQRIQEAFSSTYWVWRFYSVSECPSSLEAHLRDCLPHIPQHEWKERLSFGGVFVNGLPVYEESKLPVPCKIEYYEPRFPLSEAAAYFAPFSSSYIVFEDDFLICAFKPARLSSMPAKEQRFYNMKAYLETYSGKTIHMPSRLDMSTQGLLVVSKDVTMHGPLQNLFQRREIHKRYLFATASEFSWETMDVDRSIGKNPEHPVLRTVVEFSGKSARTKLTRLTSTTMQNENDEPISGTLVEALPLTGRTHQIRVHASHAGIPIFGDNFYGGPRARDGLHLLSDRLSFVHPISGELLDIRLPRSLYPAWAV